MVSDVDENDSTYSHPPSGNETTAAKVKRGPSKKATAALPKKAELPKKGALPKKAAPPKTEVPPKKDAGPSSNGKAPAPKAASVTKERGKANSSQASPRKREKTRDLIVPDSPETLDAQASSELPKAATPRPRPKPRTTLPQPSTSETSSPPGPVPVTPKRAGKEIDYFPPWHIYLMLSQGVPARDASPATSGLVNAAKSLSLDTCNDLEPPSQFDVARYPVPNPTPPPRENFNTQSRPTFTIPQGFALEKGKTPNKDSEASVSQILESVKGVDDSTKTMDKVKGPSTDIEAHSRQSEEGGKRKKKKRTKGKETEKDELPKENSRDEKAHHVSKKRTMDKGAKVNERIEEVELAATNEGALAQVRKGGKHRVKRYEGDEASEGVLAGKKRKTRKGRSKVKDEGDDEGVIPKESEMGEDLAEPYSAANVSMVGMVDQTLNSLPDEGLGGIDAIDEGVVPTAQAPKTKSRMRRAGQLSMGDSHANAGPGEVKGEEGGRVAGRVRRKQTAEDRDLLANAERWAPAMPSRERKKSVRYGTS